MKNLKFLFIAIITTSLFASCSTTDLEEDNQTVVETEIDLQSTGHGESTNTGGNSGQGEVDTDEE